jgi:hypothetical protein
VYEIESYYVVACQAVDTKINAQGEIVPRGTLKTRGRGALVPLT